MELCGLKKKPIRLWWGVERHTRRIVAWALGERTRRTGEVLARQLSSACQSAHIEYTSDHHKPYLTLLAGRRHTPGKAHTHHIESMNNKLRCYLARLRRKTHAYSKSAQALLHSLLFVWGRKFNAPLKQKTSSIPSPRIWDEDLEIPI